MRRKVFWMLLAVALLVEALLGGGTYFFLRAFLIERTAERMEDMAYLLLGQLEDGGAQEQLEKWAAALNAQHDVYRLTVVGMGGEVTADTDAAAKEMENHQNREEIERARRSGYGQALRYSPTLGGSALYVAVSDGTRVLRISQDFAQIEHLQRTILMAVAITGGAALAAACALSTWAARRVQRPIEALRLGAGRLAKGELSCRIADQPDELGALARDFNIMAERLEASLRKEQSQQAQMRAVLRAIPAGVIAMDAQGRITLFNPEAARLLGLRAPLVGEALAHAAGDDRLTDLARKAIQEGAPGAAEWARGETVIRAAAAPIGGEGEAQGAVLALSDMTQMRRLERLRSEFVSNATHELKTPLTAIRGCIETLRDPQINTGEPQFLLEMLEIMDVQGERLQALISDMLELSRIESTLGSEEERGELCAAVREAAGAVGVQAEKLKIELAVDAREPALCRASAERLRRIAQNLMENAVRYNHPGGHVWVTVRREGAWVTLCVRDDGVGIPQEDLPRLCERFYRVDKDRSRNSGGTGLGLAIVKHLVRRYEGELEIRSQLGEGSVFTVRLPCA